MFFENKHYQKVIEFCLSNQDQNKIDATILHVYTCSAPPSRFSWVTGVIFSAEGCECSSALWACYYRWQHGFPPPLPPGWVHQARSGWLTGIQVVFWYPSLRDLRVSLSSKNAGMGRCVCVCVCVCQTKWFWKLKLSRTKTVNRNRNHLWIMLTGGA